MAITPDDYKVAIASAWTDYSEVEVVRLSYSTWGESIVITNQLDNGTQITTSDGVFTTVNVPMKLSDESQEELVSNTRSLSIQGLNDIVAHYEDLTSQSSEERIKVDIYGFLLDRSLSVSSLQAHFTYYVLGIDYSQKSNSATLRIATTPTNNSECGVIFSEVYFPSMRGFE